MNWNNEARLRKLKKELETIREIFAEENLPIELYKEYEKLLSPHGYTLFHIAQDIYTGTTHIKINELCNRYVVTDDILKLIEAAVNIGRGVTIK